MALWSHDKRVVVPIVIIILGHWSLILQGECTAFVALFDSERGSSYVSGVLVQASWDPLAGCVVVNTNNTILAATFIYSMCFDLVILLMSMYKLVIGVKGGRSQLMTLLFKDGLVYFFIAYVQPRSREESRILNVCVFLQVLLEPARCCLHPVEPQRDHERYLQRSCRHILHGMPFPTLLTCRQFVDWCRTDRRLPRSAPSYQLLPEGT